MGVRSVLACACLVLAACSGGAAVPGPETAEAGVTLPPTQLLVEAADSEATDTLPDRLAADHPGIRVEPVGATGFFVVDPADLEDYDALLESLRRDPRLKDAAPNYIGSAPIGGPSEAPILGGDLTDEFSIQPGLEEIGALDARLLSTGAGVTVALLDTGVDFAHPLLAGALRADGWDFVDGDPDPREERNGLDDDGDGIVDGQFGHGTFVASLVLAVAPDARLLPVRVLDDEGFGKTSRLAEGLYWAVERGARVVNVSMELNASPRLIQDAVAYARSRGVLVIAAAGNDGGQSIPYPAREDDVLAIAATDRDARIAPFSNWGDKVGLAAPGVDLVGALPVELGGTTARWSGTSFATPVVAGAAALLAASDPSLDGAALAGRLRATASPLAPDSAPIAGGRLDLRALLTR